MSVIVKAYTPGDLNQLAGRLIPSAKNTPLYESKLDFNQSISMFVDGRIEACCGCVSFYDEEVELWSAPSKKMIREHKKFYASYIRNLVEELRSGGMLLTVHVESSDKATKRWLEFLGLKDSGRKIQADSMEVTIMEIQPVKVGV